VEPWYRLPLARVAAAVTVLVIVVNILAYRQAHRRAGSTVSITARPSPEGTDFAVRRQKTAIAQVRVDVATARAAQTVAARVVATLQARATSNALQAAHIGQTARAGRRKSAAARARVTFVAQVRATTAAFARWQTSGPIAGTYELLDTTIGVRATAGAPQTGASSRGGTAPDGSMYLWFTTIEHNGGTSPFSSSPSHFSIVSSTGTLYRYTALDSPPGSADHRVFRTVSLRPRAGNGGFLRFQIPNSPYTYTLLWQEPGQLPHSVCHIQVGSGGRIALTP
jgi:hypothetical protein